MNVCVGDLNSFTASRYEEMASLSITPRLYAVRRKVGYELLPLLRYSGLVC